MSFVHHEPDLSRTPCLACDEPIALADLHRHAYHRWRSCCSWHPYHYWCIRPATTQLAPMDHCADCGERLDEDDLAAAIEWAGTLPDRVHGAPQHARPPAIRLVGWWRRPRIDTEMFPLRDGVREANPFIRHDFEIVHDDCCADDWRDQLRAAPTDDELREVYADHLETIGDLVRAEFVRVVLRRRRAAGDRIAFHDRELRTLRIGLPGAWCRDVARAY